ncbi:hypothetical protein AB0I90_28455 [Micromonospora wenchangensis]|uniref:hypothetical protein n=1 Tax=Micromonospora wenchangensis TaxID=1185415 RepID=UPI0033C4AB5A
METDAFYLDRTVRLEGGTLVAERKLDGRDHYLHQHLVDGVPTMPGVFVTEIAAQAARRLVPQGVVTGFRDLVLDRFLRLGGGSDRAPLRVRATLRSGAAGRSVVDVVVTMDVVAPSGQVLVRDRRHFSVTVLVDVRRPAAPTWPAWPTADELPVPDPYLTPGSPVRVDGAFVSTTGLRLHPLGARARYTAPAGAGSVFDRFTVPVLLLDGLLRLIGTELVDDRYVPIFAPTRIRRIDLHVGGGDVVLGGAGAVELFATPRAAALLGAEGGTRALAVDGTGRVLVQIKDVVGVGVGGFDTVAGRQVDWPVIGDVGRSRLSGRVGVVPL